MAYRTVHRGNRLERELPALRLLSVITAVWFLAAGWADNGLRAALGGWHTRNGHFQPHEDFMK